MGKFSLIKTALPFTTMMAAASSSFATLDIYRCSSWTGRNSIEYLSSSFEHPHRSGDETKVYLRDVVINGKKLGRGFLSFFGLGQFDDQTCDLRLYRLESSANEAEPIGRLTGSKNDQGQWSFRLQNLDGSIDTPLTCYIIERM